MADARREIRDAIGDAESGDSMDQDEINHTVRELKREKNQLGKLIESLRLKRGGILEEMDSAHFDFKKTVRVRLVRPVLQGAKLAFGFWIGTALLFTCIHLVLRLFGLSVMDLVSAVLL